MFLRTGVALLVLAPLLSAQGERGSLDGIVVDPTGAVVPSATVRALHTATGVEHAVMTSDAGVYRIASLPAGTYRVTVSAPSFKTAVRENIAIGVAQTLTVNFDLQVGSISEQVTVSSESPLIESGTFELGSYVSKKEFDTWPIVVGDGRRQIQQFIFTSLPGTVGGTWAGSINGSQNFSHEILIDGMSIGRMDLAGGANNEFSPSAEAVSEFKLQRGSVSAQYTGGQTAVANFATKSGTNSLRGTAYYYGQNDALMANSFNSNAAGVPRQPFRQHNYGYSAGGPVVLPKIYDGRNKSFWFHNLERTTQTNLMQTDFTQLPTADFKRGNFSRLLDPAFTGHASSGRVVGADALGRPVPFGAIYDPATSRLVGDSWVRDPFPGNIVPRNQWSPVARNILELAPIADPLFDTMLRNTPSLGTCCPRFGETMLTFKGDHLLNSKHRLSGLFNRNFRSRFNSPGGRWGMPPDTPTNVYQWQDTPGTMVRLAYDATLTPTFLARAAVGYNRFGNLNQSYFVDQDWPQQIGMQNVPGTHFPRLLFGGQPFQGAAIGAGGGLGSAAAGGSFNGSTIVQTDFTYVRGRHILKFGMEHRRYYFNQRIRSGSGTFTFHPNQTAQPGFLLQTGHSFASFLLGAYDSTSRGIALTNPGSRWRSLDFYIQDDWKVTNKLTLNIGLRWGNIGGLHEVAGRMSGIDFDAHNPAAGRPGALVFADDLGARGFMQPYHRLFAPKFGFAYAMNEKLVWRGAYGINNTPPILNGWSAGSFFGYNGSIVRNRGNTPVRFAEDTLGFLHERYPDFVGVLPNKDPSLANGLSIDYYRPDATRLPYVQNWSFGFQYELPASTVLEINYIGNKGTRLRAAGFSQPNNLPFTVTQQYGDILPRPWTPASPIPQPFRGFAGTNLQALRPFPQYLGITDLFPNIGSSSYHSMQAQVTRHFRGGFSVLGAYTWSKAIGLTDDAIGTEGVADVFNQRLERSITNFNFPHFLKASWIYELPFGAGRAVRLNRFADVFLGGWQLSGIHTLRSGAPVAIGTAGLALPTGTGIRPDWVMGQNIVNDHAAPLNFRGCAGCPTYLNPAAFANPPLFPGGQNVVQRLGTLGPMLPNIRDRHFVNEDVSIQKQFKLGGGEGRYVELRGTFLNPFNRAGIGGLITNIMDPNFGQFTGQQRGPRNIELALRIHW